MDELLKKKRRSGKGWQGVLASTLKGLIDSAVFKRKQFHLSIQNESIRVPNKTRSRIALEVAFMSFIFERWWVRGGDIKFCCTRFSRRRVYAWSGRCLRINAKFDPRIWSELAIPFSFHHTTSMDL